MAGKTKLNPETKQYVENVAVSIVIQRHSYSQQNFQKNGSEIVPATASSSRATLDFFRVQVGDFPQSGPGKYRTLFSRNKI